MNAARFSVGINYWPRTTDPHSWHDADLGEIRADLAHIAALGLDAVRIFIRWDELQPQPDQIEAAIIARIATVVERAAAAGLRTLPTLCGAIGDRTFMPRWAETQPDLYRGSLLAAQRKITQAIGEQFGDSPHIVAWDLGHAFSRVRAPRRGKVSSGEHASEPVAERDVAEWSRQLAGALRARGLSATAGTYDGDLIADTNVRLGSLCAPFAFASMQGSNLNLPFARNRLDPEAVPFLAMIAAAFSFKPVLVTAVGNPNCPAGLFSPYERFALPGEPPPWTVSPGDPVFATYPCLSEDENAAYAMHILERLHEDGRLGVYWWCWADGDDSTGRPHERTYGIIRRDGTEKPIAAALAAFARERRQLMRSHDMPMISSTYYYRTLPTSTRTLYDAFLGFIAARRGAA